MQDKFCVGCGHKTLASMRICANCGSRNFSASPTAPVPRYSVPLPVTNAGNQPPPSRAQVQGKRFIGNTVPFIQARLLSRPIVAALVAGVVLIFAAMLGGSDHVADILVEARPATTDRQITESSEEYATALKHILPDENPESLLVANVGARLVDALAPASQHRYRFHVIQADSFNAFAMPGGEIFVHRGLLKETTSVAQLAAVLAHEIQHVEKRHGARASYRAVGRTALFGMVFGVFTDDTAFSAVSLSTLKYQREHETEADLEGAKLLERAGISRQAMVDMLNAMADKHGSQLAWLSSHPDSRARAKRIAAGGR